MNLEEILQHAGVKGMKWGVRKAADRVGFKAKKTKDLIKSEVKSRGREIHWMKEARKLDKMSTKEIVNMASRIQMENDMKRLTKRQFNREHLVRRVMGDKTLANNKDRENYRNRGDMSNAELKRKLSRLRAKDQMGKAMMSASKEQVETGKAIYSAYKKRPSQPRRSRNLKVVDGSRMENVIN